MPSYKNISLWIKEKVHLQYIRRWVWSRIQNRSMRVQCKCKSSPSEKDGEINQNHLEKWVVFKRMQSQFWEWEWDLVVFLRGRWNLNICLLGSNKLFSSGSFYSPVHHGGFIITSHRFTDQSQTVGGDFVFTGKNFIVSHVIEIA